MSMKQLVRHGGRVCLLLIQLQVIALADELPEKNVPIKNQDLQRLAEIFFPSGAPDIQGNPWVALEVGPSNSSTTKTGWLIEDSDHELQLLDWNGNRHCLRKPKVDETRPKIDSDGTKWIPLERIQQADHSVAWEVEKKDYLALSKEFLAQGVPLSSDEKKPDENNPERNNVYAGVSDRFLLAHNVLNAARYSYYAHLLGKREHAAELYRHAMKARSKYAGRYNPGSEEREPFHNFVAERFVSPLRNGAIFSAHRGESRRQLLMDWEYIAAIKHHSHREKSSKMVKHYQSLLEEDARRVEPDVAAVKKMTTEQQVAYWLYRLRDHDAGQSMDLGMCSVFGGLGFGPPNSEVKNDKKEAKPNPASELRKLGMAAVPQLIAHLDDARPTRCKGHWRHYWPEGHYLLRYGDCCQQIFESISDQKIYTRKTTVGYPIHDEQGKECRAKAEKWWREYQAEAARPKTP